jgi:hypothetical protein
MSVADLSNSSIEFDIDGKTYKVKKLNILDIFVKFETDIRQDYIQSISDMAKILDSKDRAEFLKNAIKELPTGRSLEDKVDEKMNTIQGGVDLLYTILQKCQEVILKFVTANGIILLYFFISSSFQHSRSYSIMDSRLHIIIVFMWVYFK